MSIIIKVEAMFRIEYRIKYKQDRFISMHDYVTIALLGEFVLRYRVGD